MNARYRTAAHPSLPRVVLAALRWWPLAGGLAGAMLGYGATASSGGAAAEALPAMLLLAGSGASVAALLVLLLLALPARALRAAQRWLRERPAPARVAAARMQPQRGRQLGSRSGTRSS